MPKVEQHFLRASTAATFIAFAQRKASVDCADAVSEVLTSNRSAVLKGDRETPFDSDMRISKPYHFGPKIPGEGKEPIQAACVLGVRDVGEIFSACASVITNHDHITGERHIALANDSLHSYIDLWQTTREGEHFLRET